MSPHSWIFGVLASLVFCSVVPGGEESHLQRLSGYTFSQDVIFKINCIPPVHIAGATDLSSASNALNRKCKLIMKELGADHYFVKELRTLISIYDAYLNLPPNQQGLVRDSNLVLCQSEKLLEEGDHALALRKLAKTVDSVQKEFGSKSYICGKLYLYIATISYDAGQLDLARKSAQKYAMIIEEVLGNPSSYLRDAFLLQALIEASDKQYDKAKVLVNKAMVVSDKLVPRETPDTKNLAVATVVFLRHGKPDEALNYASQHRKEFRTNGDVRYVPDVSSEFINELMWVVNTLTEQGYYADGLFVLDYMIEQIQTSKGMVRSNRPLASFYNLKSIILRKMGRDKEARQSLARSKRLISG